MVKTKFGNNSIQSMCSQKQVMPSKEQVLCKVCGEVIGTMYLFVKGEKIFGAEPSSLNIVFGSHPQTGRARECDFIVCSCSWEKLSPKLSKAMPNHNLYECENPNPEEGKGYFITAKEVRSSCLNDIFVWQTRKKDFEKVLKIIKKNRGVSHL